MSGGSLHDYLHKKNNSFKLSEILRVATDISKGMNYLHQNNIIHRDLKTANLLMDENKASFFSSIISSIMLYDLQSVQSDICSCHWTSKWERSYFSGRKGCRFWCCTCQRSIRSDDCRDWNLSLDGTWGACYTYAHSIRITTAFLFILTFVFYCNYRSLNISPMIIKQMFLALVLFYGSC